MMGITPTQRHVFDIIRAEYAASGKMPTVSRMLEITGKARSDLWRVLHSLVERGWLEKTAPGYALRPRYFVFDDATKAFRPIEPRRAPCTSG